MKIRTRLILALSILAGVIVTVTITAVVVFSHLGRAVAVTMAENLRSIEAAHAMRQALDQQDRGYLLILAGQGGRGREQVADGAAAFREQLDIARDNVTVADEAEIVESIATAYGRYLAAVQPFLMPPPPPLPPPPPPPPPPAPPAPIVLPPAVPGAEVPSPASPGAGLPAAGVAPVVPPVAPSDAVPPPAGNGGPAAPVAPASGAEPASDETAAETPGPPRLAYLGSLPLDTLTYGLLADERREEIRQALYNLAALNRGAADHASEEAARHGWQRSAWVVVVGLLGVGLAAFFGRRLYRSIAVPLEAIERGIAAMRRGEYGRRIGHEAHDELGELAAAVNATAEQFAVLDAAREGRARLYERLTSAVLDTLEPNVLVVDRGGAVLVVGRRARERLGTDPVGALRAGADGLIPPGEIDRQIQAVFELRESRLPPPPGGQPATVDVRPVFGRGGSVLGAAILLPSA